MHIHAGCGLHNPVTFFPPCHCLLKSCLGVYLYQVLTLIAQTVVRLECGHKVTVATDYPTHASATAGMDNNCQILNMNVYTRYHG